MSVEQLWDGRGIVDLSLTLAEDLPCTWPGHMPYQQKTFNYFTETGGESPLHAHCGEYQTRWLLIDEHTGTHIDAPAHFIPRAESGIDGAAEIGSVTVEQIPLSQLIGPAVVVDVTHLLGTAEPGQSPAIEPEHLEAFERESGTFQAGEIVLFRSNWDGEHYRRGADGATYAQMPLVHRAGDSWPAPSAAAMRLLMDRGVRCVGTDGPSMGSSHDGRPVHVEGLGGGAVYIEALAHLAQLPTRGAVFVFAPLKVEHGTGAPGRAFAMV